MNGLALLIPIALLLGLLGLAAFFWSVRDGQYDDMDGAAMRVLIDDEDEPAPGGKDGAE
jgi:cbb3-type cytochrome oxidase maturation protein